MYKVQKDENYIKKVEKASPDSPLLKDCVKAFLAGGIVCVAGEGLFTLYAFLGAAVNDARTFVSISLIVITAALTGIGVYDKIAKHAGAGVAVPITGFANSVVAPAVEFSTEGHILGTAVKMFSLAGPVIVYGCSLAVIYGIIYYCFII